MLDGEPDPRLLATFKVRSAFIVRQSPTIATSDGAVIAEQRRIETLDAGNLRRLPDGTYYDITEGVDDDEVTLALVNVGLRKIGDPPLTRAGLTDGVRIAWRNEVQAWRGGHPDSYGQGDEALTMR